MFALFWPVLFFRSFPRKAWAGGPASVGVGCCDEVDDVVTAGVMCADIGGICMCRFVCADIEGIWVILGRFLGNESFVKSFNEAAWLSLGGNDFITIRACSMQLSLSLNGLWLASAHVLIRGRMLVWK